MLSFKKIACASAIVTVFLVSTVQSVELKDEPKVLSFENLPQGSKFIIKDGTLKEYQGDEKIVVIPEDVRTIDFRAFARNKTVEEIVFPESLESINSHAFADCENLKSASLPDGVKKIDAMAFGNCQNIKFVKLGKSISYIGEMVFYGCESLQRITVHAENQTFESSNGILYNKGLTILLVCPEGKSVVPKLPDSLREIASNAFFRCKKIETIKFNKNLTKIYDGAFYGCESLKKINLSGKIRKIRSGAFIQCLKLETVIIGKNVKYIGASVFAECPALKNIFIKSANVRIGHKMGLDKEMIKIIGHKGSTAEVYALKRGLVFEELK